MTTEIACSVCGHYAHRKYACKGGMGDYCDCGHDKEEAMNTVKITLDNGTCMWMLKTTWALTLPIRDAYRAGELPKAEARARLYPMFRGDQYFRVRFKNLD